MTDIANLLTALLEGDLTAAVPVLDWLRERGDTRADRFIEVAGTYLLRREDPARYGHDDSFRALTENLRILFWPELPDTAERLKDLSHRRAADPDLLRQLEEAQEAERPARSYTPTHSPLEVA